VIASPGAIAFELGPLTVRWYGILMATSIGLGFWLAHRQAEKEGLPADDILRVAQWAVIAGLIGARLYEVAFNWDYYGRNPWKIPAVWEGGLAMHGGIIVGFLTGVALAIHWRVPVLPSRSRGALRNPGGARHPRAPRGLRGVPGAAGGEPARGS